MTLNEAQTRALQIDPQLRAADWKLNDRTQVRLEVPVDGYDAEPWNGVTDYCLYDASGSVLSVVEAKRCSRNAREADEQLRHYVTEIAKKQPFAAFGFMANGHDIWFWEVGLANPRLIAGFFAPADLERMKFLHQNRRPLETIRISIPAAHRRNSRSPQPAAPVGNIENSLCTAVKVTTANARAKSHKEASEISPFEGADSSEIVVS